MIKKKNFNGYNVELEVNGDETSCWIEKGNFSGSLEMMVQQGVLYSSEDSIDVPVSIINLIDAWAKSNGY